MLEFLKLNSEELDRLDKEETILVSAISPIEVHGPHLPLGTDLFVAREVMKRFVARIEMEELAVVHLPDLPLGAQTQPVAGSLPAKWRAMRGMLIGWGDKLSKIGFRHWFVFDNHGGPGHQLAMMEASKRLLKRRGFHLVVPFLTILRDVTEGTANIDLPPDQAGGPRDLHAGTNETSVMLAARPELVSRTYSSLPPYAPHRRRLLGSLLRLLGKGGIAEALEWISDPANPYYHGDPSKARKESGEVMLDYHVARSLELFRQALAGTYSPPDLYRGFMKILLKIFPEW
jgi:creatinine amidohydrolase/Fe(II)-dependent formamide hydrolase-like protein